MKYRTNEHGLTSSKSDSILNPKPYIFLLILACCLVKYPRFLPISHAIYLNYSLFGHRPRKGLRFPPIAIKVIHLCILSVHVKMHSEKIFEKVSARSYTPTTFSFHNHADIFEMVKIHIWSLSEYRCSCPCV